MNTVIYHNCNKTVDRNSKYCAYCGNKMKDNTFSDNINGDSSNNSVLEKNKLKENNLNKKIILGADGKDMLICKIIVYPLIIFLLIVFVFLNAFWQDTFSILVICDIFIISMILLLLAPIFLFGKPNIVIEDSIIIKYGVFNIKKKLGNISEITSFCEVTAHIAVLKNDKLLFTFNKHGRDDNVIFYNYLKNNYSESIYVNANQTVPFVLIMFGILLIVVPPLSILLIVYGINEKYKSFQIYNEQVIFKSLFSNRMINLCDLAKIEYASNKYYSDGRRRYRYGRRMLGSETYIIAGFDGSSKRCFKADKLTPENLQLLKEIIKKYEIKLIPNDYLYV